MTAKIIALEENNSWSITLFPLGKHPIGCKWIYKIKYKLNGSIEQYNVRLVAKGYTQRKGLDYLKNFSFVAKMVTV